MKTYKANNWLLENGYITEIKRGRRSRENVERLNEAVLNNVTFSDYTPVEIKKEDGTTVTKNAAKPQTHTEAGEVFIRYGGPTGNEVGANSVWKVTLPDGKELKPDKNDYGGLRTGCAGCRLSLVGCKCPIPTVHHGGKVVRVTIERR